MPFAPHAPNTVRPEPISLRPARKLRICPVGVARRLRTVPEPCPVPIPALSNAAPATTVSIASTILRIRAWPAPPAMLEPIWPWPVQTRPTRFVWVAPRLPTAQAPCPAQARPISSAVLAPRHSIGSMARPIPARLARSAAREPIRRRPVLRLPTQGALAAPRSPIARAWCLAPMRVTNSVARAATDFTETTVPPIRVKPAPPVAPARTKRRRAQKRRIPLVPIAQRSTTAQERSPARPQPISNAASAAVATTASTIPPTHAWPAPCAAPAPIPRPPVPPPAMLRAAAARPSTTVPVPCHAQAPPTNNAVPAAVATTASMIQPIPVMSALFVARVSTWSVLAVALPTRSVGTARRSRTAVTAGSPAPVRRTRSAAHAPQSTIEWTARSTAARCVLRPAVRATTSRAPAPARKTAFARRATRVAQPAMGRRMTTVRAADPAWFSNRNVCCPAASH